MRQAASSLSGFPRRLFFALWPEEDIACRLDEAAGEAQKILGGRRLRRENLHLTLSFLGEVAPMRIEALGRIADALQPAAFRLCLDHGRCLERKMLYWAAASVVPAGLRELVAMLDARLKAAAFRTETRAFVPHVTLLRNARCGLADSASAVPLGIEWPVHDFVLAESELRPQGASYRILQRWPLCQI